MSERAVPWRALPREANRYMLVSVVSFMEQRWGEGQSLTVVMATERAPAGPSQAWNITFQRIAAYRMRPIATAGQAPQSPPFPKPQRTSTALLDTAVWEVVQSQWLADLKALHLVEFPLHHYVMADYDVLYEIAAAEWVAEELPEDWEDNYRSDPE
jgi:hypothetical protein